MKFKTYYKYLTILGILLLAYILVILFNPDISVTKKKKNSESIINSDTIINMALILNDCPEIKSEQMLQALDSISSELQKTYAIFKTTDYNNSYEDTITAAAGSGASLIICPDASFEETIYNMQTSYVNVYFLIVDGIPHNSDYSDSTINYNVIPLTYDDSEIGFLVGCALAYDGYKDVSFVGLNDTQSPQYFYGLLNGINYASQTLEISDITVKYSYTTEENCENIINKMYDDGSDILVAHGDMVIQKADNISGIRQKPCIICSENYDTDNNYIIASTYKNVAITLHDCIYNFYTNNSSGGSIVRYSSEEHSIGLIFGKDSFKMFNSDIYNIIYQELAENKISVISDTTISPEDLELKNIKIIKQILDLPS